MIRIALLALALFSTAAFAHPEHEHVSGFASGFVHPFTGLDHLLAMIALGIWAAQWKSRSVMIAPGVFVSSMLLGALYAFNGGTLAFAEHGIALSVLAIGLLVAFVPAQGMFARLALPIIAVGAAMHGYAHGAEMPATAAPTAYLFGFALATALLHLAGIALGTPLARKAPWRRIAGFAIAAAGAAITFTI